MDALREHLLGRLVVERGVVADTELQTLWNAVLETRTRGRRATLGLMLVKSKRLEPTQLVKLQTEIELRGRACIPCGNAYFDMQEKTALCPTCGAPNALPPRGLPLVARPSEATVAAEVDGPRIIPADTNAKTTPGDQPSTPLLRPFGLMPRATTPQLGSRFGPYELLAELGRGGMGVVHKAKNTQTGEVVALKVLLAGETATERQRARFQEEIKAAAKLDHPNIVAIRESGLIDGTAFYTMMFVEGRTLHSLLDDDLPVESGARVLAHVALGVHHAHTFDIIHRDLKPANIMVEAATGHPYIMDFGLAKDLGREKQLSKTGVAIGTYHYMAPEQALGKHREIDARTDTYALGAILFECITKETPFDAESNSGLIAQIVNDAPRRPRTLNPKTPPSIEAVALKALSKKKEARYQTAADFAKELAQAIDTVGETPGGLRKWLGF